MRERLEAFRRFLWKEAETQAEHAGSVVRRGAEQLADPNADPASSADLLREIDAEGLRLQHRVSGETQREGEMFLREAGAEPHVLTQIEKEAGRALQGWARGVRRAREWLQRADRIDRRLRRWLVDNGSKALVEGAFVAAAVTVAGYVGVSLRDGQDHPVVGTSPAAQAERRGEQLVPPVSLQPVAAPAVTVTITPLAPAPPAPARAFEPLAPAGPTAAQAPIRYQMPLAPAGPTAAQAPIRYQRPVDDVLAVSEEEERVSVPPAPTTSERRGVEWNRTFTVEHREVGSITISGGASRP